MNYYGDYIWERLNIEISNVEEISAEKQSGFKVTETGNGTSSGPGVYNYPSKLNATYANSGDSSFFNEQRHNITGGEVNSYGTLNSKGEYVYTEAEFRTVTINGVPHTTWVNKTIVRDANGKILRTSYSNDNTGQSFSGTDNIKFTQQPIGNSFNEQQHNLSSSNTNSYGTVNSNGEYVYTEAKLRTVWTNGVPHTTWENKTIVKDGQGNIIRTSYSNDNAGGTQQNIGTSGGNLVDQGSSTAWQTNQEQARAEQQRRILEQTRQREDYERRKQEEAWRAEQERRRHEEALRNQQISYGGQVFRTEEERRRYLEERRRHEESQQQGGVQESKYIKEYAYQVGGGTREGISEYDLFIIALSINNLTIIIALEFFLHTFKNIFNLL